MTKVDKLQRKYLNRIFASCIIEKSHFRRLYISEQVKNLAKLRGESEEYVLLSIKNSLEEQIEAGTVFSANLSKILTINADLTAMLEVQEEVHA